MNETQLIDILTDNRLMRSSEEVNAFEKALAELTPKQNREHLRELHLILDDQCQHPEVMFGLVHFLESFDVKEQLQAFLAVLPQLSMSAPEWTKILYCRIQNDESAWRLYQDMLSSLDASTRNIAKNLNEKMTSEPQTVNI